MWLINEILTLHNNVLEIPKKRNSLEVLGQAIGVTYYSL